MKIPTPSSERESAFTMIEMMVVVLIIGILAAIATPVYLNQKQTAFDAVVTADVVNGAKELMVTNAATPIDGPVSMAAMSAPELMHSKGTVLTVVAYDPAAGTFCLTASHPSSGAFPGGAGGVSSFDSELGANAKGGSCPEDLVLGRS